MMRLNLRSLMAAAVLLGATGFAQAQTTGVERAFNEAKQRPAELRTFLWKMPKGGDLHVHLTGAVYAESFIDAAAKGLVCIDKTTMSFVPAKASTRSLPPQPVCGEGQVRASDALHDQKLYDALVNSFSMRNFVPTSGWSGHDQFFATFNKFGAASAGNTGRWVDEVATRAAHQNEVYVEIMHTPDVGVAVRLVGGMEYTGDVTAMRAAIKPEALQAAIAADMKEFEEADADRKAREHCGTAEATKACGIQVRFLFQVLRALPPAQVFAQTLLAFELASRSPLVVGLNFVQPEDTYASMSQYEMEMKMVGAFHALYPKVHISLHAGELAQGMVPTEGLRFHILQAVQVAHAERIGHGVDVMYEHDAVSLLQEMAAKHIMVEINLTSNDGILGVRGPEHPLRGYMVAKVPVALSTDDEGVSRSDITNEYVRGVLDQGLTYADLKRMTRTSLEHSFLAGESLWAVRDSFVKMNGGCVASASAGCRTFLATNERAAAQWELERRFAEFEKKFNAQGGKR